MPTAKRVALVTGGAIGIGRAVVRHLASSGRRLGIIDLPGSGLQRTSARGRNVASIEGDVRDEAFIKRGRDILAYSFANVLCAFHRRRLERFAGRSKKEELHLINYWSVSAPDILRVTLPLGLQLISGTRLIIDSNKPMTAPFGICLPDGCLADYDASGGDLIANMKKGHGLTIQAINSTGQPISLTLPLSDFAKAYDGPPTDPKVIEEHQKLQEELQRSAEEARKKLDQQQGQQQGQPRSSSAPSPDAPQAAGKP